MTTKGTKTAKEKPNINKDENLRAKGLREIKDITEQILAIYNVAILSDAQCLVLTSRKTGKASPLMAGPLGPLLQINALIEDSGIDLLLGCESLIGIVQNLFDYARENRNEVTFGGVDE